MSFELLDNILVESGNPQVIPPVEPPKNDPPANDPPENISENIDDDMLYSDLDQLIENSMRATLRTAINESTIDPEIKINQLTVIENVVFTKEQTTKFVDENIHPILDCAGVFSGTYNLGGDAPIAVSLPVYETALMLHIANEGLLESISKEKEEPAIKNSLYESIMDETKSQDVGKSIEIVNDHLAVLYDKYEITDDSDREALFKEAVHVIKKYGVDNLRPSFYELAECVLGYNKKVEGTDEKLFGEISSDVEVAESDNIFTAASTRLNKKLTSLIPQSVKDKFKNITENTTVPDDSSIISIANTATGISAMVAWREGTSKCAEDACEEKAIAEAINAITAQENTCKNTGNIKMCELCNKKLADKWEIKKKVLQK